MKTKNEYRKLKTGSEPENASLENRTKRGQFVPDPRSAKDGKIPGGSIAGTIFGPNPGDEPAKVIFSPVVGPEVIPAGNQGGIEKVTLLFKEMDFVFPFIPANLASRLREIGKWSYATRKPKFRPYNMELFVEEAAKKQIRDYVIIDHDGYGNSWALHYFLAYRPLYLFLQIPWGGLYEDANQSREYINYCFEKCSQVTQAIDRLRSVRKKSIATNKDVRDKDTKIFISISGFYGNKWFALENEMASSFSLTELSGNPRNQKTPFEEAMIWIKERLG